MASAFDAGGVCRARSERRLSRGRSVGRHAPSRRGSHNGDLSEKMLKITAHDPFVPGESENGVGLYGDDP